MSEIKVREGRVRRRINKKSFKCLLLSCAVVPVLLLSFEIAWAQSLSFKSERDGGTVGAFGGIGLLEMRNARFGGDGDLSAGVGYIDGGQNYYATWQATPWLETTLRFSDYKESNIGINTGGIDKGLDIKIRILEEGKYKPAIAIGLQDMLGDGLFSGEYIVASKKIDNFDLTMGFGFGNLANRTRVSNFARVLGGRFKNRTFNDPGSEKLRFGNYFSGEKMGFFWGVEYNIPIDGLTAKVEYSTVDKSTIDIFQDYKSKTAFNVGVNYKVKNWLEISAGLLHGNQLALQFTLKQNLHSPVRLGFAKGPAVDEIRSRSLKNSPLSVTDYKGRDDQDIFFERLQQMGYVVNAINLTGGRINVDLMTNGIDPQSIELILGAVLTSYPEANIDFPNGNIQAGRADNLGREALRKFRSSAFYVRELDYSEITAADKKLIAKSIFERMEEKALKPDEILIGENEISVVKTVAPFIDIPMNIGRTVRILSAEAPDTVERFNIISKERGIKVSKVSVLRKDFEKIAEFNSSPEEIFSNTQISKPGRMAIGGHSFESFPQFEYGILPDLETHFGSDKDDHFKGDLNLKIYGRVNLSNSLQFYAEAKQHIIGNIDMIPVSNNVNVHHVRSDIGLYAAEGTTSIRRLSFEYIKNPTNNIYTRITAGHLEAMYSGVSAEILYRQYGGSLSFGLDINLVKQRGYNQLFKMRDYETVTGHATLYYVNKKYDITSKVSFGRYLAKDWGTTIDISRQFGNGIRIGAMATFTNMSESNFGRGNFDKGVYMTVPFDFFWFRQSRDKASFKFRRLGKNGGQKLDHNTRLFDLLSPSQPYKISNSWNRVLE
ncbi:MAG: YjbH domain-containing protein [Emcibacteraceae bacterium]|nr:YjbH domain-containing protein [Emcibacteraceae bacterium]